MGARTKDEWLKYYGEKTGCKDLELSPDELVLFNSEHGFITIQLNGGYLEIHHMCGSGKYWEKIIRRIMEFEGIKKLRGYTERSPEAWMRKYGGHIKGYYMEASLDDLKI